MYLFIIKFKPAHKSKVKIVRIDCILRDAFPNHRINFL